MEYQGKVLSASDWIPEDAAITSLTAEKSLTIRYPIRMKEDLLPVRHLADDESSRGFQQALGVVRPSRGSDHVHTEPAASSGGTYTLHSKRRLKMEETSISTPSAPCLPIASRSSWRPDRLRQSVSSDKDQAPEGAVSMVEHATGRDESAREQDRQITDLNTSCMAAGRRDLAYELVEQLQNALDSLKHKC